MPASAEARSPASLLTLGAIGVALLAALAAAAPWIAPHPPSQQADPVAGRYLAPGSRRVEVRLADGGLLLAESARPTARGVELERLGRRETVPGERLAADEPLGRRTFWLGSDGFGRDVLSRLLWGARTSLFIGVVAAGLALALGVVVGGLAGLAGGWLDGLLMRGVDALLAFPRLFLIIALAALLESGEWVVIAVLGGTGWMAAARLLRGEVLSVKRRDFVLAAEAVGQRPAGILRRYLLPNALTPVLVDTALRVGDIILVEAALSFLGLGVQPPAPSWGNMVAEGSAVLTRAWWISVFPGLAVVLTVVAFNLLGDGLADRRDPRRAAARGAAT